MSYEGVVHKPRLPSNHFFYAWKKKKNPIKKKDKKKNEDNFYVHNIFTTNIRWQVIMNSNLNVIKTFLLIKWIF